MKQEPGNPSSEYKPRILVYGIERVGLNWPLDNINNSLFQLEFEKLNTTKRFHDYEGVILFQSTFEKFEQKRNWSDDSYFEVHVQEDELVRRKTQASQLLEAGGFICFVLHTDFIDRDRYGNFSKTDLSKIYLNYSDFYRERLGGHHHIAQISRSEFRPFLKEYGTALTYFSYYSKDASFIRPICTDRQDRLVGLIIAARLYFLPSRLPTKDESVDYFTRLATALISCSKKLLQEIPLWADEYKFIPEKALEHAAADLQQQLGEIKAKQEIWKTYKRCLCFDGDLLVEAITSVLRNGLGLRLSDRKDEKIEDTVILDEKGNEIILVEIKGDNENAKSNAVYQADGHRGRREKPDDFPSLLVINTFIKSSNKLIDKDKDFHSDQIKLAVKKRVLMMRTLDLLNLVNLKEKRTITTEQIAGIFQTEAGWLKVSDNSHEIRKE